MENDRELLEYAAKAAGIDIQGFFGDDEKPIIFADISPDEFTVTEWNPLTDDGDALRLATHCEINIKFTAIRVIASFVTIRFHQRYLTDRNAAARLAIVRCAAEIGKRMNGT